MKPPVPANYNSGDSSSGARLVPINPALYPDYRQRVIFSCCKWDPQVGDINTISDHVVVLSRSAADQIARWTEQLAAETHELEEVLRRKPELLHDIHLPPPIVRVLRQNVSKPKCPSLRLMRFDFHPTVSGWAVSEVNSDVPGGFAEASTLPELAAQFVPEAKPYGNMAQSLVRELVSATSSADGVIALVHATSYSDDRQVMQYLDNHMQRQGLKSVFAAPDHIVWKNGEAWCYAEETLVPVSAIVRFFPVEWLPLLPRSSNWQQYLLNSSVPACNHGSAVLTQSKRLPLIWKKSGCKLPAWQSLLPETAHPARFFQSSDWILKPALGRVGEGIALPGDATKTERFKIALSAVLDPRDWVAQRKFESLPIASATDKRHICIGAFAVGEKFCGFYGRVNTAPKIDGRAQDIPVLVETPD